MYIKIFERVKFRVTVAVFQKHIMNVSMYIFNIKAKGHEGHLHCSTLTLQYKFKQQYAAADKSYLIMLMKFISDNALELKSAGPGVRHGDT